MGISAQPSCCNLLSYLLHACVNRIGVGTKCECSALNSSSSHGWSCFGGAETWLVVGLRLDAASVLFDAELSSCEYIFSAMVRVSNAYPVGHSFPVGNLCFQSIRQSITCKDNRHAICRRSGLGHVMILTVPWLS